VPMVDSLIATSLHRVHALGLSGPGAAEVRMTEVGGSTTCIHGSCNGVNL
jgi:hypothetical protein